MKKSYLSKIQLIALILLTFTLASCKEDIEDLSKVIYVRHKGADMPAYIHGNASEKVFLIVLHGGPGGSGLEYRGGTFRTVLEKEFAVVYFDQRGSGMSQGNYSKETLTIKTMTEDVMALTDVIRHVYGEESTFFLLGHSWGGTLGTATLLEGDNQDRFKGWIEVDGGHDLKGLYFENIRYFRQVALEQIAASHSVGFWNEVMGKINQVDSVNFNDDDSGYMNSTAFEAEVNLTDDGVVKEADDETSRHALGVLFQNNPLTVFWNGTFTNLTLATEEEIWETVSYNDRLHEIEIPSLVLWGRYDLVIPPQQGQEAFDLLGSENKELIIFEESGHSPMVNEGDKFADAVVSFVRAFR